MTTEWLNFQTYQELQALKAQVASLSASARIVGLISMYSGSTAPAGFLLCQGQNLPQADYADLFAVIGTTYGSLQAGFFSLPDLQSRFPYGRASSGILGSTGGSSSLTEFPSHSHSLTNGPAGVSISSTDSGHSHSLTVYAAGLGGFGIPFGNVSSIAPLSASTTSASAVITSTVSGNTDTAGSANPVSILPPYITLNYIICFSASTG